MIGYKAFDKDLKCKGFQYEIGKTYEIDVAIKLCEKGFHFCKNISDCFKYYGQSDARFAKIEAFGEVIPADDDSKCVTDKIKIIEEIPRDEAVRMTNSGSYNSGSCNSGECNSGDRNSGNKNSGDFNSGNWNAGNWNSGNCNSGYGNSGSCNSGECNSGDRNSGNRNSGSWNSGSCNSGNCNSGNCNSGNWNSGNCNSGNWNSGDWNSGDWNISSYNNGCFMSVEPTIMMFNKPTSWTIEDWRNSKAKDIMQYCPLDYTDTEWVLSGQMTDDEKTSHPGHKTMGGYLKIVNYKPDRQAWWDGLSAENKREVMSLPNFDADVFYECTGIRVQEDEA